MIIVVPQCTHSPYKNNSSFSSQGKKRRKKTKGKAKKEKKRGEDIAFYP